jgi:4-hydroxy-4-methyl-2-oxoglutarate aldolase
MAASLHDRAAALGAATLHEAQGRIGALGPAIKPLDPAWRVCGPAYTILSEGGDNLWVHRGLYDARPGDVLVFAPAGQDEFGYWGEILAHAAIARGIAGFVIDGGVRDTTELRELGLPTFARAVSIRGTVKGARGALQVPVAVGGALVAPGDLIVGDEDGVVVVERARIEEVVGAGEARAAKEADYVKRLGEGATTLGLLGLEEA